MAPFFPNFEVYTTTDSTSFYYEVGDSWSILFSHLADCISAPTFPECPGVVQLRAEFAKRGLKIITFAHDSVQTNEKWLNDIETVAECTAHGFPTASQLKHFRLETFMQVMGSNEQDFYDIVQNTTSIFVLDDRKKLRMSKFFSRTDKKDFVQILRDIDSLLFSDYLSLFNYPYWTSGMMYPTYQQI